MTPTPHALATALALAAGASLSATPAAAQSTPTRPAVRAARPGSSAPEPGAARSSVVAEAALAAPEGGPKATLAQQARSWEDRGRSDFAASAWRKLLAVEPGNTEALYGLTLALLNLGQPDAAAAPMAALKKLRPDHPGLRKLDRHLAQGSNDASLIKEARRLAAAGQHDAAAREYELLLSDRPPQGPIALEYYQTLGGTPNGWEPARRGLERLARIEPADARYPLALARHLSYREPNRREAVHQLAALSRTGQPGGDSGASAPVLSPEQRQEAREAWRQALLWLDAREADQPLYRQFLETGEDNAVRTRLAALVQAGEDGRRSAETRDRDPSVRSRRAAFDALGGGDLAGAAERFQRVLKERPRDADALGGLGVVRLREGRLVEARELLAQAVAGSGGATSPWQKGLHSVDQRLLLQQADQAMALRQPQQALDLARRASQLDAQDAGAASLQGEALLELGQAAPAETQFRLALSLASNSEAAWRGLLRALHAQGRSADAALLVDTLDEDKARRFGGRRQLAAEHLRLNAETLRRRGDLPGAEAELEQALQLDPQAPWVRLALAQRVLARGQEAQARALMDELQPSARREADSWWAHAQWQAELQEPLAGLAALNHVPPTARTAEMGRLHRRLRVLALVTQAQGQIAQGQGSAALAVLQQAQTATAGDPELLPAVANAYADAGQGSRALQLLRGALAQERSLSRLDPVARTTLQLQYAQLLQTTKQDGELVAVLAQIQALPLTPAQREQFDNLRVGISLRQVEQLREAGDIAEAYELLAPLLAERPADARPKLALARLHASVGDANETLETLDTVLLAEPDTLDVWLSAASIASSVREHDYALGALQRAATIAPQDSRVLAQYSRYYRSRGDLSRAADYMRAAIASQRAIAPPGGATSRAAPSAGVRSADSGWGRPLSADNPFAARAGAARSATAQVDSPADQPPRRLPPLPGLGLGLGTPAAPLDTSLRASTEDWLRAGRIDRASGGSSDNGNGDNPPVPPRSPGSAIDRPPAPLAVAAALLPLPATDADADPRGGPPGTLFDSSRGSTSHDSWTASVAYPTQPPGAAPDAGLSYGDASSAGLAGGMAGGASGYSLGGSPGYGVDSGSALGNGPSPGTGTAGSASSFTREGRLTADTGSSAQPRSRRTLAAGAQSVRPGVALRGDEPGQLWNFQALDAARQPMGEPELRLAQQAAPTDTRRVSPPRSLRDELAEIVAERGSREIEGAAALRWRNGESGLSQLVELRSPISFQAPLGELGKLQIRVTPTLIDAGSSPQDAEAASRFGSQALGGTPDSVNVSAAGVGLRLGLAGRGWAADVGTTPLGFRIVNAVGGLQFGGEITPQVGYGIELQRRAVTDSVLSYAGVRDSRSGTVWGGVTASGLGGSLDWKDGDIKLASWAGLQWLDGRGVRTNQHLELGAQAIWRLSDEPQQRIEVGPQLGYQHYAHNLRYFTLGHGGYFSPQHHLTLALPMKATGRDNRLSWSITAAPGLSAWREDSAPYFPLDGAAQAQLQTLTSLQLATQAVYAGRSSFGMSLGLQGGAEYNLSNRLLLGSRLSLDTASQYTQLGASLYLRLRFDGDAAPRALVEPAPRHD
jgi:Flp pilus assembly protein TadD